MFFRKIIFFWHGLQIHTIGRRQSSWRLIEFFFSITDQAKLGKRNEQFTENQPRVLASVTCWLSFIR
jgi:hypothetical protein